MKEMSSRQKPRGDSANGPSLARQRKLGERSVCAHPWKSWGVREITQADLVVRSPRRIVSVACAVAGAPELAVHALYAVFEAVVVLGAWLAGHVEEIGAADFG